jgi:outer membrane lipoprotein-sorting protein
MSFCEYRPVRWFTLAAAACLAFGASAAEQSPEAVFQRIDKAAAQFKGLTADMKRVAHEGAIDEEEVSSGTIKVKLPKPHDLRMLLDFQQPDAKQVELSGTKILIYYPKTKSAEEYDFGRSHRALMEQYLKLGFGSTSKEMKEGFNVEYGGPEKVEGQDTTRLSLTPKSPEVAAQFPKFELWISDANGIAIQQKMYEPGKSYNLVTYTNVHLAPNLPDSAVKISLPAGLKPDHRQR